MRQRPLVLFVRHRSLLAIMSDLSIMTPEPSRFGCNASLSIGNYSRVCTQAGGNFTSQPLWCATSDEASTERLERAIVDASGNYICHNAAGRLSKPHTFFLGSLAAVTIALAVASCC